MLKPRRVLRALKLNELSAVDRPAVAGATAAIMKRSDEPTEGEPMSENASAQNEPTVIYKSAGGDMYVVGQEREAEIAKRYDARLAEVIKDREAEIAKREDLIAKQNRELLLKRAAEQLPNLAGSDEVRADLLKFAESKGDEHVAALKAADEAFALATKANGHGGNDESGDDDYEVFRRRVIKIKNERNVTELKAREMLREEDPDLYNRAMRSH